VQQCRARMKQAECCKGGKLHEACNNEKRRKCSVQCAVPDACSSGTATKQSQKCK